MNSVEKNAGKQVFRGRDRQGWVAGETDGDVSVSRGRRCWPFGGAAADSNDAGEARSGGLTQSAISDKAAATLHSRVAFQAAKLRLYYRIGGRAPLDGFSKTRKRR